MKALEYWSGLPFPAAGIIWMQGSNPCLLNWQVSYLQLSHQGSPWLSYISSNLGLVGTKTLQLKIPGQTMHVSVLATSHL